MAYHLQTNRLTERFNKTLCKMISKYVIEEQNDWDEYIEPVILLIIRQSRLQLNFHPII